jgi:hypothetical protein
MATIRRVARSHLSPDGGSLARTALPLGSRWLVMPIDQHSKLTNHWPRSKTVLGEIRSYKNWKVESARSVLSH